MGGRASLDGDRVAMLAPPGGLFVASLLGILRAGGVAVVLSPLHPAPELEYLCADAGVRDIIATRGFAGRVSRLGLRVLFAEDAATHPLAAIAASPGDSDPALQMYTSGTTRQPKGAVLTHGNLAAQQELLAEAWGLGASDVLLHVLPLHHIHGLGIALLPALGVRAGVRFVDFSSRPFDAAATWEAMGAASVFMAVPSIHARLMSALDRASPETRDRWTKNARALRLVTSGSAALPVSLGERWRSLTGAYPLERFGMTEVGVALSNPLDPRGRRPGSVGAPLPTVQTRIADDDGRDATSGELWVAGPSVFAGYHGLAEATSAAFVMLEGQRWFKTGDTVARDADGSFRVLGRTSLDIVKSGGYKLSALEIEESVREHEAVAEVAVVGLPDPEWGQRAVACVVAREGREDECAPERLRAFLKQRIAPYKVPRQVVLFRELPRNALGKVLKAELTKRLA